MRIILMMLKLLVIIMLPVLGFMNWLFKMFEAVSMYACSAILLVITALGIYFVVQKDILGICICAGIGIASIAFSMVVGVVVQLIDQLCDWISDLIYL